jgi:hypothetical protein
LVFCVGVLQFTVTEPVEICVTAMLKAGRDAVLVPLLTLMMMFA